PNRASEPPGQLAPGLAPQPKALTATASIWPALVVARQGTRISSTSSKRPISAGTNRLLIHEPDALAWDTKNRANRPLDPQFSHGVACNRPSADRQSSSKRLKFRQSCIQAPRWDLHV